MEQEEWKTLVLRGKVTTFQVSNMGRLKNLKTGNILKPNKDRYGYLRYHIDGKNYLIHRLVMMAFVPNPNNYPQVNHLNGDKTDNRLENLEWCDASRNIRHSIEIGLRTPEGFSHPGLKGENNPTHKYSNEEIIEVCELLQTNEYCETEVSRMTGVSRFVVNCIKRKVMWTHLTGNYNFDKVPTKMNKYSKFWNSVDRAIINGIRRKTIVQALMNHGVSKKNAQTLHRYRKDKIAEGKSLVQNTVYIDDGIEIF